jgi:hypothetical protein
MGGLTAPLGWRMIGRGPEVGRPTVSDTVLFVVIVIGSIIMMWGGIALVFFMIDDIWWGRPHSIGWLPGGWQSSDTQVLAATPQRRGIAAL